MSRYRNRHWLRGTGVWFVRKAHLSATGAETCEPAQGIEAVPVSRETAAGPRRILLAACAVIATTGPTLAQKTTFAEMLARAQAQAAAGHRWTPPGDNMTETVVGMMDLIPTASAEQLAELSALLESDKERSALQRPDPEPSTEHLGPSALPAPPAADSPGFPVEVPPTPSGGSPGAPPLAPFPASPAARSPTTAAPPPTTAVAPPPTTTAAPAAAGRSPAAAGDVTAALPARPVPPEPAAARPLGPAPIIGGPVPSRPTSRAVELFARGQQAERQGDVSGARRFYSIAAQQGHATAARNLGRLYDAAYLKQTALGGIAPDPALARHWYEQAIAMGDAEAGPLLEALSSR
jgi:hypothetical protein